MSRRTPPGMGFTRSGGAPEHAPVHKMMIEATAAFDQHAALLMEGTFPKPCPRRQVWRTPR
jgi:hypothetical protein